MPSREHYRDVLQPRPGQAVWDSIDADWAPEALGGRGWTRFCGASVVAERIGRGEVELDGAWFDVERADLHAWSNAERRFVHMDEETISRALSRRAAASS